MDGRRRRETAITDTDKELTEGGPAGGNAVKAGVVAMLPVLIGIVPFAAVAGLAGTHNGLSVFETAAFSVLAFAGAAQIAALDLIGDNATAGVVIATALVINLRFIVYSATLAPLFEGTGWKKRIFGSYALVDHAIPLTMTRTENWRLPDRVNFYLGGCLAFWLTWQVCSLVGSLLGSLPETGIVAFAVPVSFLALLAPQLTEKPKVCAAAVAALVAVACAGLPANLGMMLGTVAGLAAGLAVGWRRAGLEQQP